MTLFDLFRLVRRRIRLIIAATLACALVAAMVGFLAFPLQRSATSAVLLSDPAGLLNASNMVDVVEAVADDALGAFDPSRVSVKLGAEKSSVAAGTIAITATAPTAEEAMGIANDAAVSLATAANQYFENLRDTVEPPSSEGIISDEVFSERGVILREVSPTDEGLRYCSFVVKEATGPNPMSLDAIKLIIIGLLAGAVLSVSYVLLCDALSRPIKSAAELRRLSGLPVLSDPKSSDFYETLYVNTKLALSNMTEGKSVCLIPLSGDRPSRIADGLGEWYSQDNEAVEMVVWGKGETPEKPVGSSIAIVACPSLAQDVNVALAAHASSASILLVEEWKDGASELENTLRQLDLAGAHVIGCALYAPAE